MDKTKMALLATATIIEIVAIILLGKSIWSDSSPTAGILLLVLGMTLLVIGIAKKPQ